MPRDENEKGDKKPPRERLNLLMTVRLGDKVCEIQGGQKETTNHKNAHEDEMDKVQMAGDDITGEELDLKEVMKARRKELEYIRTKSKGRIPQGTQRLPWA